MSEPLLSILIPTRNRVGYLRECLASVQTTTVPCEILVADNASTDSTPELMAGLAGDSRIRYVRHEHDRGLAGNHRYLLQAARGRYVCILGDDDLVGPGNFERKVALLEAHPDLAFVYSRNYLIDADGRRTADYHSEWMALHSYAGGRDDFYALLPGCFIALQSVVFRRALWLEMGDFDDSIGYPFDWDLLLTLCRGRPTGFICEPLVAMRQHPGQASRSIYFHGNRMAESYLAIWRKWLLRSERPPILSVRDWAQFEHNLVFAYHHLEERQDPARLLRLQQEFTYLKQAYLARQRALHPAC